MKLSEYKSYDDLPLFLNASTVAKVLGVSPSSGYELMHDPDFPVLRVGSRMVVPKEKFREWVEQHMSGSTRTLRTGPNCSRSVTGPPWKKSGQLSTLLRTD